LKFFHETNGHVICSREFQVMSHLEKTGFPVPKVYLAERRDDVLGSPFLIMNREKPMPGFVFKDSDWVTFAKTLANLHNYDASEFGNALAYPKDAYSFAERSVNQIRGSINEIKLSHQLKSSFEIAARWLQRHVYSVSCPKYCLLHGDYHPENILFNINSKMMILDWDWAEIGDPACDLGYTYHSLKFFCDYRNPSSADDVAEHFVSEYLKNFKGDVLPRLKFYKLIGALRIAVMATRVLSNPVVAYKYLGPKALFGFPFLEQPLARRWLNSEKELVRVKYFEDFVEANYG